MVKVTEMMHKQHLVDDHHVGKNSHKAKDSLAPAVNVIGTSGAPGSSALAGRSGASSDFLSCRSVAGPTSPFTTSSRLGCPDFSLLLPLVLRAPAWHATRSALRNKVKVKRRNKQIPAFHQNIDTLLDTIFGHII